MMRVAFEWWIQTLGIVALALGAVPALGQDIAYGKDIYGPCAACHGASGEGGKEGEYPRLAGHPADYTVEQLKAFQRRQRSNLPMFPYTEPRELSEQDMKDVAAYLASLKLSSAMPELKDSDSALDKLLAMEKVFRVPQVDGDQVVGGTLYKRRCAVCHGAEGQGKRQYAPLAGQYPRYLMRQLESFRLKQRPHISDDPEVDWLLKVTPAETQAILAWLTSLQDQKSSQDGGMPQPVGGVDRRP